METAQEVFEALLDEHKGALYSLDQEFGLTTDEPWVDAEIEAWRQRFAKASVIEVD